MYLMLNLLSKRLVNNVFVSNNSLKLKSFHSFLIKNRQLVHKNCFHLYNNENKLEISLENNHLFSRYSYSMTKRNFSKINSSEDELKSCANNTNNDLSTEEESKELLKSTETKFKKYSDVDSEVIYDVSEELMANEYKPKPSDEEVLKEWKESEEEVYLYQHKTRKMRKVEKLVRGLTGVFDIQELVQLLRSENLKDIAVIEVPEELDYCQYLVLANVTSKRHFKAFVEYFKKVYKMKKEPKDPYIHFGGSDCDDWKVVDMKNIVLHLFMKSTRDYYDIETLWTVGHEFDDKIQKPEPDSVTDIMEKHMKFLQEMKPSD